MAGKAVFCIASNESQAWEIINQLKLAGFENDDISALLPDKTGTRDFAHECHTKASEGTVVGGFTGGLLGAALGWLAGIDVLAIPGLAPFTAGGAVLASLSAAALGMVSGGSIGALIGLGLPEYEARRYQGKMAEDNILISVHCDNHGEARRARNLFDDAGAHDIATSPEAMVRESAERPVQPASHTA